MVNKHEVNSQIMPLIEKIVKDHDLILVEADFVKDGGRWRLRIYIYHPQRPITHEDCENISRTVGDYLEELVPTAYSLEVSSPGLDRKLKSEKEYYIFKGKKAKVKLKTGEVYITEINEELMQKYRSNEISQVRLEPEYNFEKHSERGH